MNTTQNNYYESVDKNFQEAIQLCEKEFTHEELIELLKNGNIPQKQIAALKLDKITSQSDAKILMSNLTGQDGKIREAVSLKLQEFLKNPAILDFFEDAESYKIFVDAVIDINANICRNVISAISNLKNNKEFTQYFTNEITKMIFDLLKKIDEFDERDGKYKVNKELFKLYWCLECVYEFYDSFSTNTLIEILSLTKSVSEYTIREKTAKIVSKNSSNETLLAIKQELQNDENYYVKRY